MSLVYGDLEMQQRQALIAGMQENGEVKSLEAGSSGAQESVLGETQFETSEILVVKTAGKSDEWEIAARIPLGQTLKHEDL